ncbi:hypothetical protein FAI41_01725 [Acetobacteraceae bacterium]|nr:hypothetical protein FAI41_01725 [Acetobacteraceae bacterium]
MSISSLLSKKSLPILALSGFAALFSVSAAQAGSSSLKQVEKWQTAYQNLQSQSTACKHSYPSKVGQMVTQDKCLEKVYSKYGPIFYGNIWPQLQEMVLSYRLQLCFNIDRGQIGFKEADDSLNRPLQEIGAIDYQRHAMLYANQTVPTAVSQAMILKAPGLSFLN